MESIHRLSMLENFYSSKMEMLWVIITSSNNTRFLFIRIAEKIEDLQSPVKGVAMASSQEIVICNT